MYAIDTSKFESSGVYGHRGLFLASLASLSLLTVTSCHIHHESTNSLIFHHSTPLARLIPAPPHQVLRFPGHGTSVTVNDLFGNMPVRVKNRALILQRPDELEREWDNLKNSLVSLVLANSQVTKLVLLDADKSKRMSIRLGSACMPAAESSHHLMFDLNRIKSIFTQSGLTTPQNLDSWHEMSASISDLTIRAAISLQPGPTRRAQFISLGNEPLLLRNSSNVLYNEVNRMFALSDFSNFGDMSDGSSLPNQLPDHASSVNRHDALSNASTRSWAKPVNRWPMFYIRIDARTVMRLDDDGSGDLPESDKSIQRIVDVLVAMVHEFLKQHNLRPRDAKQRTLSLERTQSISRKDSRVAGSSPGPLNQGRSISSAEEAFSGHLKIPSFSRSQFGDIDQSFTNWSRVKAAKDLNSHSTVHRTPRHAHPASDIIRRKGSLPILPPRGPDSPGHGRELNILRRSRSQRTCGENSINSEDPLGDLSSDKLITWIDPHTKLAYSINPRTGQTMNSRNLLATQHSPADSENISSKSPGQPVWIENMLVAWDNPSFSRTEVPIPNLGVESAGQQIANISSHDCFKGIGSLDTAQVAKYRGKLPRCALETAEVIAQVDKKFILAKVHTTSVNLNQDGASNDVLLLIDQHAADERCRIEQLFGDMFLSPESAGNLQRETRVCTVQVGPLTFELSSTEGGLFKKYMDLFSAWGIGYVTDYKIDSTVLISVHTLPVLIAERCRLEPHVLIDLMRREIWSSEEDGRKPFQPKKSFEIEDVDEDLELPQSEALVHEETTTRSASRSWVQQMNGCPQGIVDLLNSRACRTAIMFNDLLTIEECQALISRLARCAFPFQCAHGRPSMVPILDLRSLSHTAVTLPLDLGAKASIYDDTDGMNFMEAFQRRYAK
jgi:DNA mismatch repair protein MLH3